MDPVASSLVVTFEESSAGPLKQLDRSTRGTRSGGFQAKLKTRAEGNHYPQLKAIEFSRLKIARQRIAMPDCFRLFEASCASGGICRAGRLVPCKFRGIPPRTKKCEPTFTRADRPPRYSSSRNCDTQTEPGHYQRPNHEFYSSAIHAA